MKSEIFREPSPDKHLAPQNEQAPLPAAEEMPVQAEPSASEQHEAAVKARAKEIEREQAEKKLEEAWFEGPELTAENIGAAINSGTPLDVKVQRSSGELESGWKAMGINLEGTVTVQKWDGNKFLKKSVSLENLADWNGK